MEGAEEFNTFDQGIAGGDDLPVETAERDAGTDVQMAAAVLRAVQLQRQRARGRVRRDTGMSAGGLCAGETSADGELPDPPSAEKADQIGHGACGAGLACSRMHLRDVSTVV